MKWDPVSGSGRRLAVLALLVTMTVWGSTFVVTKTILDEAGPFSVTVLRFGIGLSVLLPFAYRRGFRSRLALEPTFLLFGLTGVALYYGLQNLSLIFTSAANAALISAGVPVAAAVLAFVFLKEHLPPARLFGIVLSVLGVLLVTGTTPSGANSSGSVLLGNALMVVAVVAYGAYAVQGRALRSGESYPAVVATTASFAAGLLFLLPLAAGEVLLFGAPELRLRGWLVLVYLGVAASALTMFLWNYALRHVAASAAALYINLVPVVGLGFALLFGEHVGVAQLVGGHSPSRGCCLETPSSAKGVGKPGLENPILPQGSPRYRGRHVRPTGQPRTDSAGPEERESPKGRDCRSQGTGPYRTVRKATQISGFSDKSTRPTSHFSRPRRLSYPPLRADGAEAGWHLTG